MWILDVHPKGHQPWLFIGRTDAETEALKRRPPDGRSRLIRKDPDAGKDWGQEEKGTTEDEMVGGHHWLSGHEFEQAPRDAKGQGSLVCCSPRGQGLDWATEQQTDVKVNKKWSLPQGADGLKPISDPRITEDTREAVMS